RPRPDPRSRVWYRSLATAPGLAGGKTAAKTLQGGRPRRRSPVAGRPVPTVLHAHSTPRGDRRDGRLRRSIEKIIAQGLAQCRIAPRSARRRGAVRRTGARPGEPHRPPALAAKAPEGGLAGTVGSHLRGQQCPPALAATRQSPPWQP